MDPEDWKEEIRQTEGGMFVVALAVVCVLLAAATGVAVAVILVLT